MKGSQFFVCGLGAILNDLVCSLLVGYCFGLCQQCIGQLGYLGSLLLEFLLAVINDGD